MLEHLLVFNGIVSSADYFAYNFSMEGKQVTQAECEAYMEELKNLENRGDYVEFQELTEDKIKNDINFPSDSSFES